jgi:hypothetical protein
MGSNAIVWMLYIELAIVIVGLTWACIARLLAAERYETAETAQHRGLVLGRSDA